MVLHGVHGLLLTMYEPSTRLAGTRYSMGEGLTVSLAGPGDGWGDTTP